MRSSLARVALGGALAVGLVAMPLGNRARGDWAAEDNWKTNPLGFSPLELHTANGLLVPGVAVGVILLATRADPTLGERWRVYQEGGVSLGYKAPHTTMYLANVGFLYRARAWLELGAELSVYHPSDAFNDTWGVGLRPVARFYPVNTRPFRLYFESGAGLVYFVDEFPQPSDADQRLGTHLNGSPKYGLGAEIRLREGAYLLLGARHAHISNGNTAGVERNPSHDSNGAFIGFVLGPR